MAESSVSPDKPELNRPNGPAFAWSPSGPPPRSRSGTTERLTRRMFEFGRDLRRLFAQARESEDLSWLELIGVDLLAVEARQQCTDAGRVSCARPHPAWLRGAALWREHARRTGSADSIRKAVGAALDAARQAKTSEEIGRASCRERV